MENLQLMIIGNGQADYFMGWLGRINSDINNCISYLKTSKMISDIGGAAFAKATIFVTIKALNDEGEQHLDTFPKIKTFITKDCSKHQAHQ